MAEETKVGMKLDMELEPIKEMCKKLEEAVKHELSKGIENVDAKELGEVVDMIKDLYEAKEKIVKACYYKQIMEAMEEHDFEDEEEIMDEGRKGYRGRSRDSMGRFTSRRGRGRGRRGYEEPMMYDEDWEDMEYMRDMDRQYGRMGYSGSGSSGGNMGGSRSGQSSSGMSGSQSSGGSMGYSESGRGSQGGGRDSREGRSGQSRRGYMEAKEQGKDKQQKMKELEEYMKELSSDVTEMIGDASPEEKSLLKQKMQVLMQKIN